ncbi:MAG: hypothetical protein JWO36_107, partial [Myxococcales bacterium]|nr:hypothetical protein [Myxococcales bacterium]
PEPDDVIRLGFSRAWTIGSQIAPTHGARPSNTTEYEYEHEYEYDF